MFENLTDIRLAVQGRALGDINYRSNYNDIITPPPSLDK
jgi:hypothetical protein